MAFTGNEDQRINPVLAAALTKAYRDTAGPLANKGQYFSKAALQEILSQEGCVGIRAYFALSAEAGNQLIVVGVTANENDLVDGYIADHTLLCPPYCSNPNILNSDIL
jgi:hypothetical protein